jgi:chemotaxis methyl-accepting protein methylase
MPESMEYLREHVLPEIVKSKGDNDPVRIWVPACSTGTGSLLAGDDRGGGAGR